jgi:hypothetical protein
VHPGYESWGVRKTLYKSGQYFLGERAAADLFAAA